jgi:hypothetical protein
MKIQFKIRCNLNMAKVIETWKKIIMNAIEYEYEVSDLGNVRRCNSSVNLSLFSSTDKYLRCKLYKPKQDVVELVKQDGEDDDVNSKTFKVHRLGATMFLPNPENKIYVNHINHDKTDNRIVNLEWSTHPENVTHAHTNEERKSTGKPIILYEQDCVTPIKRYESIREAGIDLDISEKNIGTVLSGRIKYTGEQKYHFKYVEPKLIITKEDLTEFEDIKGYPNYMIHRDGRIYNKKRKMFMKGREKSEYLYIILEQDDLAVHRTVAFQFLLKPKDKDFVNHKDGNKFNNHVDNLEWTTKSENSQHAYDTGLNPRVVGVKQYKMDGTFVASHMSIANACKSLKIDPDVCGSTISSCCKYRIKHAYNFIWRYETDTSDVQPISISSRNGVKKISQFTLDGKHVADFDCISDAAEKMTGKRRHSNYISKCCKGRVNQAHGFVFKYKEE